MDLTFGLQLVVAAMMSELHEKLKASTHPALAWIGANTTTANRAFALTVATLTSIGLSVTWYVDPTTSYATFTLSGIPTTVSTWSTLLVQIGTQFYLQKGWYKLLFRPTMPIDLPPAHQIEAAKARGAVV